jgi:phage shock protein PspC (stress-responsive transcriptional regulator)
MDELNGPAQTPRLTRRATDRVFLGVCGGLGDYFGVDPVLIRLAFVLVTLAGGAGLIVYIVLAMLMPVEVSGGASATHHQQSMTGTSEMLGLLFVAFGVVFLAGTLGWLAWLDWSVFWPVVLIGLGLMILLRRGGPLPTPRS